jgi:hypothetical protein
MAREVFFEWAQLLQKDTIFWWCWGLAFQRQVLYRERALRAKFTAYPQFFSCLVTWRRGIVRQLNSGQQKWVCFERYSDCLLCAIDQTSATECILGMDFFTWWMLVSRCKWYWKEQTGCLRWIFTPMVGILVITTASIGGLWKNHIPISYARFKRWLG